MNNIIAENREYTTNKKNYICQSDVSPTTYEITSIT